MNKRIYRTHWINFVLPNKSKTLILLSAQKMCMKLWKKIPILTVLLTLLFDTAALAQTTDSISAGAGTTTPDSTQTPQNTPAPLDRSPMDISYFPVDYPILKIQDKVGGPPIARVLYSRPQKRGRTLFGDLIQYGQVWRLGANEATEIEFFRDVRIDDKTVKKGRYTLYALVDTSKWVLILNKETDTWGAFKYEPGKDVLRTVVPVEHQPTSTEVLSIVFEKSREGTGMGADLVIEWDDVRVKMPIAWAPVQGPPAGRESVSTTVAPHPLK